MSGPVARSRADQWRGRSLELIQDNIADDLDDNDREHGEIRKDIRDVKRLLFSILISTTTASILLAVNIVGGFGK